MKIEETTPDEDKKLYKVVRRDNYVEYDGSNIIAADDETGEFYIDIKGEKTKYNLGPDSIRIIRKDRRGF